MRDMKALLEQQVLLADGAMGTELYARGIFFNHCFESINLSQPELVAAVHTDYIRAGAQLIETNTFGANHFCLTPHGLGDKVAELNRQAATIAISCAKAHAVFVAGAVGPLGAPIAPLGKIRLEQAREAFREQITALADGGVDVILFETFTNLEELILAVETARTAVPLPIIAQFSTNYLGNGEFEGIQPTEAVAQLARFDLAAIGANCSNGPTGLLECIRQMRAVTAVKLSAMPNAGLPQTTQGRLIYLATPEYMGEYARRLAQTGANIIGGCCGTTPQTIREMAKFLKSTPTVRVIPPTARDEKSDVTLTPLPTEAKGPLAEKVARKFCVSVEINPPAGLDLSRVIAGVRYLKEIGVDALNIPDGPRAMARLSPIALAQIIRKEVDIPIIIHYCCRDRNLLGMQMDLLGAHALGLNNVLLITGDPPKMGTYPDATAVFDVDAIGLIHLVDRFNHGVDLAGRSLGGVTNFLIGCGCNPGAVNLDEELARYAQKIAGGVEFVFSQPVFDQTMLQRFLEKASHGVGVPFFGGIMPLVSLRNAEFFHNEVPGMHIPEAIMQAMRKASSREAQLQVGLDVARENLHAIRSMPGVTGAYIFPPLGKYELVGALLEIV